MIVCERRISASDIDARPIDVNTRALHSPAPSGPDCCRVAGRVAPRLASAAVDFSPMPKGWRTFALTTRVEPNFATKAWIPLPTFTEADWQRPGKTSWTGNARTAEKVRDPKYGMEMLKVE